METLECFINAVCEVLRIFALVLILKVILKKSFDRGSTPTPRIKLPDTPATPPQGNIFNTQPPTLYL